MSGLQESFRHGSTQLDNRDLKQGRRRRQWKRRLKKLICALSNLIASIWTRSICQMQATFPGELPYVHVPIKRQIRRFHVVVVQWTSKKCTKKREARAELLFWSLNRLFFWSCRWCRRRSCLSSLIECLDLLKSADNIRVFIMKSMKG